MSTVELVGRMILALVVVIFVMWGLAKWARKPLGAGAGQVLTVLARQQLSRTSSVAVVKVLDQALVLGVTEQGIRLLTEVDLDQVQTVLSTPPAPRERRLRRPSSTNPGSTADPLAEPAPEPVTLTKSATAPGRLDGSVLSPRTWHQAVDAVRDLTARR
ncbi:flagellar biosynthetic protein FliO [Rhodococcus sp. X156]|uniref:FliO/MopB family protein n=1 Tax=Rhodococcus sp. X156 TaxID=2499145 RepID=UPI000FD816E3|nr:flagellar biosynthetic protein FliO [Rhodococcus sp. X156]